jgi:hypothetical protein
MYFVEENTTLYFVQTFCQKFPMSWMVVTGRFRLRTRTDSDRRTETDLD